MSESSLKEIQAITELAEILQPFIPANAYPYSKPKVDFGIVAKDVGIGNLWPGGSKLLALHGRATGHSRIGRGIYIIFEKCLPLADVIRLKVRKFVESGEFHYPVLKLIPEILNAKNNNMFGEK